MNLDLAEKIMNQVIEPIYTKNNSKIKELGLKNIDKANIQHELDINKKKENEMIEKVNQELQKEQDDNIKETQLLIEENKKLEEEQKRIAKEEQIKKELEESRIIAKKQAIQDEELARIASA